MIFTAAVKSHSWEMLGENCSSVRWDERCPRTGAWTHFLLSSARLLYYVLWDCARDSWTLKWLFSARPRALLGNMHATRFAFHNRRNATHPAGLRTLRWKCLVPRSRNSAWSQSEHPKMQISRPAWPRVLRGGERTESSHARKHFCGVIKP